MRAFKANLSEDSNARALLSLLGLTVGFHRSMVRKDNNARALLSNLVCPLASIGSWCGRIATRARFGLDECTESTRARFGLNECTESTRARAMGK